MCFFCGKALMCHGQMGSILGNSSVWDDSWAKKIWLLPKIQWFITLFLLRETCLPSRALPYAEWSWMMIFLETPSCLETNDVWRLSIALPVSRMPGKEIPSAQRGLWLPGWISYRTVSYHDPWGIQDEPGAIGLFFGLQRCSKGVVDVPLSFVVHIAFSL